MATPVSATKTAVVDVKDLVAGYLPGVNILNVMNEVKAAVAELQQTHEQTLDALHGRGHDAMARKERRRRGPVGQRVPALRRAE